MAKIGKEEKVCTFEQARKLKELKITLDTECCWIAPEENYPYYNFVTADHIHYRSVKKYPAPDVSEIVQIFKKYNRSEIINLEGCTAVHLCERLIQNSETPLAKTENQKSVEFEKLSRPLVKFINDNYHPHVTVVITPTTAELLEGSIGITTEDYLRD